MQNTKYKYLLLPVLLIPTSEWNFIDQFTWPISGICELPHFSDIEVYSGQS